MPLVHIMPHPHLWCGMQNITAGHQCKHDTQCHVSTYSSHRSGVRRKAERAPPPNTRASHLLESCQGTEEVPKMLTDCVLSRKYEWHQSRAELEMLRDFSNILTCTECSTVSNAAESSSRMRNSHCYLSIAWQMSLWTLGRVVSVLWNILYAD